MRLLGTWWASKPLAKQVSLLSENQNIFLRKLARKTWSYFEHFVEEKDNWLPPDNFQEQPEALVAHRTSPTNIGLSLLANLSAYDFGYLSTNAFIDRTSKTINTMKRMERYKGHFYNWYDTESLTPLLPKYISTVDSGNLAAHLLVLRQGLLALPYQKILSSNLFEGIRDTWNVLIGTLKVKDIELVKEFNVIMETACSAVVTDSNDACFQLVLLSKGFSTVSEKLDDASETAAFWWKQILGKQLEQAIEDIKILDPLGI